MSGFQALTTPAFLIASLIVGLPAILFFIRYRLPLATWAGIFLTLMSVELACYYLVLTNTASTAIQFWFRALILVYLLLLVAWLFFIFILTGHRQWVNRYTLVSSGILLMAAGNPILRHPNLNPVWMETTGSVTGWVYAVGPFGYLFVICIFGVGFISLGLLFQMLLNSRIYYRNLALMLFIGTVSAILACFLELGGYNPFAPVSIVQLIYVVNSAFVPVGILMFRAGSILPVARDMVFEHIQDGVLILDRQNRVIDMNSAAAVIVGQADHSTADRWLAQIWEPDMPEMNVNEVNGTYTLPINGIETAFDVKTSAVMDINQKETGRVVVLRNITGREQMEKALHEHAHELIRTNRLAATLSGIAARLGSAPNTELGFDMMGAEMRKLGLDCGIITIDPAGDHATIKYLSFSSTLLRKVEKITGLSALNHEIPKRYWPGDRVLKEKVPVWYPNPRDYIHRMFPQLPKVLADQAFQLLGILPTSQICILPLLIEEKVIGAMPIWGTDLQPADNPVLALFARQVAYILQNVIARENEIKQAAELMRSNAMILALSKVATLLGNSSNSDSILDTLGSELRGLGLECGVVVLDPAGEVATIKYLSFEPRVLQMVEKLAGVSAKGYAIPRAYWSDDRVIREKQPVWYSDPRAMLRGMFPGIADTVVTKALQILGFNPETQLCMLPLISMEKAIGAILIWGEDLQPSDGAALAVFASQVASILQGALAYEVEAGRANELARSNSMILTLSKVAAQLESSSDSEAIFNTVGKELQKLGMNSIVGIFDENKQNMRIKYLSLKQDVIRWAEKIVGRSMDEMMIPRRLWPTEKVVNERSIQWSSMSGTLNMFPFFPKYLHNSAMKMAGINSSDPVCYLPLANEREVIGVLGVWGANLKQQDVTPLSILASQLTTAIRNSILFENESRRAVELGILLEASEATTSASQLSEVLLSLAAKLLELSGFEACYISEWDKETNMVTGLIDHTRIIWRREKQDIYSLKEYPRSEEVLLTGRPMILQGDFEAEEKRWMNELGRTALMVLALRAGDTMIGLVEIAYTKANQWFDPSALQECQRILDQAAATLNEPLSENPPGKLFLLQSALLKASGGEICSFSEWEPARHRIRTVMVSADIIGQSARRLDDELVWKLALYEGKASYLVGSNENKMINDFSGAMPVESTLIFPLRKGDENIGLIELYDLNHERKVTPEQIALLRTMADKASYSIQNARLLQQTQMRLSEKTELLNEKEVLLKEVHHRVKNNLQVISSLLNLQSARLADLETVNILKESQNRVRTMALIHEKLYQSDDLARIDFESYLRSLITFLTQSYRGKADNVTIHVAAREIMLNIDVAIPCGLIINELVSNSLKYAFPDDRPGRIELTCIRGIDGNYTLTISDDGVGLPAEFDIAKASSLGLKLVLSLVTQLDGKLEWRLEHGTTAQISFKQTT